MPRVLRENRRSVCRPSRSSSSHPGTASSSSIELLETALDEAARDSFSRGSAIRRAGRAGFGRNVCVALGNWGSAEAVPVLSSASSGPAPVVRAHAAWALGRISSESAVAALGRQAGRELDPSVSDGAHPHTHADSGPACDSPSDGNPSPIRFVRIREWKHPDAPYIHLMTHFSRSTTACPRALEAGLLLSVAVAAPGAAQRVESVAKAAAYYETYEAADSLYDAGHYAEAADALEALSSEYSGDPSVWFSLARVRDRLGERHGAIEAYRIAIDIGYQYGARIPYRVAQLYALSGAVDSAFIWLGHALEARWDDRRGIARDEAFATLRGDSRFGHVVGAPPHDLSRDEGWRFDIDYVVQEARRMHAGPGDPAISAEFGSGAAALKAAVPDLSNEEIVVGLQRLMTVLGDGHTGIYGPGDESSLEFDYRTLPVVFYAFDDGLYIVDGAGDARRWIGYRVVAFGPRPAADLLQDLPAYVHHDNAMTPLWLGVHFTLRRLPVLDAMGATDDPKSVSLLLEDGSGTRRRVVFDGGAFDFRRKLRPPQDQSSPPRWLRHVERNYWLDRLPEAEALYWQFNQVRDAEDGPSISEFADTLRAALETTGARTLVVDVRHNNGGNNGLLDPLLRTLVWWEQDEPGRRIFVITGRNTFSAAQNFINRVERWTDAVFVGEPSSSRPNFTGEETALVLPYSGVRGSISNRYWQDSGPDDMRPWIAPRVPVPLSAEDYFAGRDPALDAILAIVSGGQGTTPRPPEDR